MRMKLAALVAGFGLLWVAVPVVAHHAVGAEYDVNKQVKLTGTVTKIEWTNPHARIYFDVTQPDGTKVNWNVELAARIEVPIAVVADDQSEAALGQCR